MNKTMLPPILVLFGILGVIGVMAGSSVFDPIIRFIHADSISATDALICLVLTVIGFFACYRLLNVLCTYFVPKIETSDSPGLPEKHACPQGVQK